MKTITAALALLCTAAPLAAHPAAPLARPFMQVAGREAVEVCKLLPAAQVRTALAAAGIRVDVPEGRAGYGSCTWRLTGQGPRSVMIDAVAMGTEAEAREGFKGVLKSMKGRPLTGIGDEALLVDGGPQGSTSVMYRSGRVMGQVNLRAAGEARADAAARLARQWVGQLPAAARVATGPTAPPAAKATKPATPPPAAKPRPATPAQPATPAPASPRATPPRPVVGSRPTRVLPPLPPLRWPDSDSAARARGLVPVVRPAVPAGVDPSVLALRLLLKQTGADTTLAPAVIRAAEAHVRAGNGRAAEELKRRPGERPRARRSGGGMELPAPQAEQPRRGPHVDATDSGHDDARAVLNALRSPPHWYRESNRSDVAPVRDANAISTGFVETLRYKEPWVAGQEMKMETTTLQRSTDGSAVKAFTFGQRFGTRAELCPSVAGVIRGNGVVETIVEVFARVGEQTFDSKVRVTNEYEFTGRVGDDAIPVGYDIVHNLTSAISEDGQSGKADLQWATTGGKIRASAGADGNGPHQLSDEGGTLQRPEAFAAVGDAHDLVALAAIEAEKQTFSAIQESFGDWFNGNCLEARVATDPAKTALREGEAQPFAIEVLHYQENAIADLPIEVARPLPERRAAGTVSPRPAGGAPAALTFTAPRGVEWEKWDDTMLELRSISRRGRSEVLNDVIFSRLDDRARFTVTARQRTATEKLGDVYNVLWVVNLEPDPDDPGMLRARGRFSGGLVGLDANCLDGYDIAPSTERISGTVKAKAAGFVTEVNGTSKLHLSLAGDLPPRDGLPRGVGFLYIEGVPLPTGAGTQKVRVVKPAGTAGTKTECSGDVESISEITVTTTGNGR